MTKRLLTVLTLLLTHAAYAGSPVVIDSPTGQVNADVFAGRDQNALPTPAPNYVKLLGNNAAGIACPTPAVGECILGDTSATSSADTFELSCNNGLSVGTSLAIKPQSGAGGWFGQVTRPDEHAPWYFQFLVHNTAGQEYDSVATVYNPNLITTQPRWDEITEMRYYPPSGPGAASGQLEHYKQFYSIGGGAYTFRPYSTLVDLATNSGTFGTSTDTVWVQNQANDRVFAGWDTTGAATTYWLQPKTGQTAALQEWRNSDGGAISWITAVGNLFSPSLTGGTNSAGTLTLSSTSHATKGKILFGSAASSKYDEATDRLCIACGAGASPGYPLDVHGGINTDAIIDFRGVHRFDGSAADLNLINGSTGSIRLYAGGSEALRVSRTNAGTRGYLFTGATTVVGLAIAGAASQTADLQQWQNSSYAPLAGITATGGAYLGDALRVTGVSNVVQSQVRAAPTQSADLQQWSNASATPTPLAGITNTGVVYSNGGFTASGNTGITASGTTCTITAITNGIITAATCS